MRRCLALVCQIFLSAAVLFSFAARAELQFMEVNSQGQPKSRPLSYTNPFVGCEMHKCPQGETAPVTVHVLLSGEITADDVRGAKIMVSFINKKLHKLQYMFLDSSGGSVDAAMQLGRILKLLNLSMFVTNDSKCLSACVFVMMAADLRVVTGKVGIHRPYSSGSNAANAEARYLNLQKRAKQYVEELGFPTSLYEQMILIPPESMKVLTTAELQRFFLQGRTPAADDEVDLVWANFYGVTKQQFLERKSRSDRNCVLRDDVTAFMDCRERTLARLTEQKYRTRKARAGKECSSEKYYLCFQEIMAGKR